MRSKGLAIGIGAVTVGVLLLASLAYQTRSQAQQVFNLKMQSSYPVGTQAWIFATEYYKPAVEKMSGGRLKLEVLAPGTVVPAFEVATGVGGGVLDAGVTQGMYYVGKHPAGALFSTVPGGPFGMDVLDIWSWYLHGGGRELALEFYRDILKLKVGQVIPAVNWGPQWMGWFKKPIRSVEDMKGLKYRIPGVAGDVWKELGVGVVVLPGGEIVPAGERGVLDAAEWAYPSDDIRMGFHKVWKFYHTPDWHSYRETTELVFNEAVWARLPEDLKVILEQAAHAGTLQLWARRLRDDASFVREMGEKFGVQVVTAPDDVAKAYLEAWDKKLVPKYLQDPFFRKVWESQKKFAELVVPFRRDAEPAYGKLADWYWPKAR